MLVAPLNWGLGHATRCIPIIQALIKDDFEPVLASDGGALKLLQKEFPKLKSYTLPSYNIKYSKKGRNLKYKLLFQIPSIVSAIKKEKKFVAEIVEKEKLTGIISDNRFGVYSSKIPSVYITHQLNVLSGFTTYFTSKIHQKFIRKFDECWVPDVETEPNFSGKLGHLKKSKFNVKYIGVLSRFKPCNLDKKYDLTVVLSGPEPQRTLLEKKLLKELKKFSGTILIVRGVFSEEEILHLPENFTVVNFLRSMELENVLNQSKLIIARSGYSTIMDLAVLGKKAFFIPTPGQFEQEYLAEKLKEKNIVPFSPQKYFSIDKLKELENYKGFAITETNIDLNLFKTFKSK